MQRIPGTPLRFEPLEDRTVLSLSILFDYTYDTNGFFDSAQKKSLLEQAGADLASQIRTTLTPISPSNGNSWNATFFNPATGGQAQIPNLTVPSGTIIVYVGGRTLNSTEAGVGGTGGFNATGDSSWLNSVQHRNGSGFSLWGGSIAFDNNQNWFFGSTSAGLRSDQIDFYTVATHELGHVLGFGTATQFSSLIQGNQFVGSSSEQTNSGRSVSLSADLAHWAQGVQSDGQPTTMEPYDLLGQRYGFTRLDYAALQDIGWSVNSSASNPVTSTTTPSSGNTSVSTPLSSPLSTGFLPPGVSADQVVVASGGNGVLRLVQISTNSATSAVGPLFQPFPNFNGTVRATLADVNGDGKLDLIATTGPGSAQVRVIDPATGASIVPAFSPYESTFNGGLFVGAADINGTGRADVIVSADVGGGPRITGFRVDAGRTVTQFDFFGIADPNFRGGARIAAADMNRDGAEDLVVAAGVGGGPRIAIWDGKSLAASQPQRLVGDFFAYNTGDNEQLRNGVYIAAGDLNGTGTADLIVGGGPGGGPRVTVFSSSNLLASNITPVADFFAYDASQRNGVNVAVRKLNGQSALVTGSADSSTPLIRAYPMSGNQLGTPTTLSLGSQIDASAGIYVG